MKMFSKTVKSISLVLCLIIVFSLTGCLQESFSFKFSHSADEVVSMRIYYSFENIGYTEDLLLLDPIREIDPSEYSDIMDKIESYSYDFAMLLIANAPSPSFDYCGYILYVEYTDGETSLLDINTRQNLNINGETINPDRYCFFGVSVEFNNLLSELAGELPQ